jgi:excisionase family DNA binding protein
MVRRHAQRSEETHMTDLIDRADEALESETDAEDLAAALAQVLTITELRQDVHDVIHAHARGRQVVVQTTDDEVSPNRAAEMLGVSRKLVEKLMDNGRLPYTTKPLSTHRLIRTEDVKRVRREQEARRTGVDEIIDALSDAEY